MLKGSDVEISSFVSFVLVRSQILAYIWLSIEEVFSGNMDITKTFVFANTLLIKSLWVVFIYANKLSLVSDFTSQNMTVLCACYYYTKGSW